jgi:hypothetical protein
LADSGQLALQGDDAAILLGDLLDLGLQLAVKRLDFAMPFVADLRQHRHLSEGGQ